MSFFFFLFHVSLRAWMFFFKQCCFKCTCHEAVIHVQSGENNTPFWHSPFLLSQQPKRPFLFPLFLCFSAICSLIPQPICVCGCEVTSHSTRKKVRHGTNRVHTYTPKKTEREKTQKNRERKGHIHQKTNTPQKKNRERKGMVATSN